MKMRKLGMRYTTIAENLNAGGLPSRKGKPWQPVTVRAIVQREKKWEKLPLLEHDAPTAITDDPVLKEKKHSLPLLEP